MTNLNCLLYGQASSPRMDTKEGHKMETIPTLVPGPFPPEERLSLLLTRLGQP